MCAIVVIAPQHRGTYAFYHTDSIKATDVFTKSICMEHVNALRKKRMRKNKTRRKQRNDPGQAGKENKS